MDIGLRIKQLRNKNNLTLEELASRCELTKGFLSQLERNLTSPSIATLEDIVEALGVSMSDFYKEDKNDQEIFSEDDFFVDERDNYKITWIIPNAQKNEMEPILLELNENASSQTVYPHEGEEFGLILAGKVKLMYADNEKGKTIRKGETFYIKGDKEHYLKNTSSQKAKVLWVCTPPIF